MPVPINKLKKTMMKAKS